MKKAQKELDVVEDAVKRLMAEEEALTVFRQSEYSTQLEDAMAIIEIKQRIWGTNWSGASEAATKLVADFMARHEQEESEKPLPPATTTH